jgi:hypothetical protein
MLNPFKAIGDGIRKVVGVLVPVQKKSAASPGLRWTVHLIILAVVLVGLYFVNRALELYRYVTSWDLIKWTWLPLLFLLLYLLGWTAWWLWKLLAAAEEKVGFADIESAWNEGVQALQRAGVQLTEVPLFLMLGRPEAPEEFLFQAARLDLIVKQTPNRATAPLHVCATRDAVYVTCAGASVLGHHASILALEGLQEWPGRRTAEIDAEGPGANTGTLLPGVVERKALGSESVGFLEGRPNSALERRQKRRDLNLSLPDLRKDRDALETDTARLEYLCSLIARDRQPFCPVNGILLLIPFGASDNEELARQTAEHGQRDLATVRRAFQMRCPVFGLVCDLETTWGFYEFVNQQKGDSRMQRLGQRFPLATDLSETLLREQIESSVQWMCSKLVREWVYHLFRAGQADADGTMKALTPNVKLFRLLDLMHLRQNLLGYVLKYALLPGEQVPGESKEPWFYGGCYLAATGVDKDREQAFVRGVLDRLAESQAAVCWTEETVARDAASQSQAKIGYVVLAGLWLLLVVLVGWNLWPRGS